MDIVNPYVPGEANLIRERKKPELEPAERLTRLLAALIDAAAVFVPGLLAALVFPRFVGDSSSYGTLALIGLDTVGAGDAFQAAMLAWLVYNLKLMHEFGQTFGKKVMGIKVVRTDGSRLGLLRWITHRVLVIGLIGVIPYVGWVVTLADVLAIFRESRQCLHDQIADTMVIVA